MWNIHPWFLIYLTYITPIHLIFGLITQTYKIRPAWQNKTPTINHTSSRYNRHDIANLHKLSKTVVLNKLGKDLLFLPILFPNNIINRALMLDLNAIRNYSWSQFDTTFSLCSLYATPVIGVLDSFQRRKIINISETNLMGNCLPLLNFFL
uniref:Uncharacterized protein n=1 Tax=Heterorhabditis bacteriophora TaxID=37862 RepID=A0A1I7WFZ6_HETBA